MTGPVIQAIKRILFFIGLLMLLPTAIAVVTGESWLPFMLLAGVLLAAGFGFKTGERLSRGQAMIVAALCWLIVPAVSTIPFVANGMPLDNAFVEAMAGWTATGLSFVSQPEVLPMSLLFFRAYIQWIGGLGIIIFALWILRAPAVHQLYIAEPRADITTSIAESARVIIGIYGLITAVGTAALAVAGMPAGHALLTTMTSVSTGGFISSETFAPTGLQQLILIALMLAGGISFALHWHFLRGKWQMFALSTELKALFITLAVSIVVLAIAGGTGALDSAFHAVSAITGTGFATLDLTALGSFARYILMLLMLSGAVSGSTTGALKLWRVAVLLKAIAHDLRRAALPRGAVLPLRVNGVMLTDAEVIEAGTYTFMYLGLVLIAAGGLVLAGIPSDAALFMSASAAGNVGLAVVPNWFDISIAAKAILATLMWLGRIEILPAVMLIGAMKR